MVPPHALLADTGPLYALTDVSDQYHERADKEFQRLVTQGYVLTLSYPVVLECYNLLYRTLRLSVVHRWLEVVTEDLTPLNPTPEDYSVASLRVRRFSDQRISLVDAATAVLAERLGTAVWTFDHHFDVMGVPVWRGEDS